MNYFIGFNSPRLGKQLNIQSRNIRTTTVHTSHNTLLHVQFAYMSSLLPDAYCVSLMRMHIEGQDGDAVCKPCCQSGYLNVLGSLQML